MSCDEKDTSREVTNCPEFLFCSNNVTENELSLNFGFEATWKMLDREIRTQEEVLGEQTAYRNLNPVQQDKVATYTGHISNLLRRQMNIGEDEYSQFATFSKEKYTRHLVAHNERFTVLMLCWAPGQRSPIHDHDESNCWVKCLKGSLRERRFAWPDERKTTSGNGANVPEEVLEQLGDGICEVGDVVYIDNSMGLHEMSNPSTTEECITVHVYAPPLYQCKLFTVNESARKIDVTTGKMLSAHAPSREKLRKYCDPERPLCKTQAEVTGKRNGLPKMSLGEFCDVLRQHNDSDSHVQKLIQSFNTVALTPEESYTHVHFSDYRIQRVLVATTEHFSLFINCWCPGQGNSVHDHQGSRSWVRVLHGELALILKDEDGQRTIGGKCITSGDEDVFVEDASLGQHVVRNASEGCAISMHLYNPPYTEMSCCKVTKKSIPVIHIPCSKTAKVAARRNH